MNAHLKTKIDMNKNTNQRSELVVDKAFLKFVNAEVLPLTPLDTDKFWNSVTDIINTFAPRNRELLKQREQLQAQINLWHTNHY